MLRDVAAPRRAASTAPEDSPPRGVILRVVGAAIRCPPPTSSAMPTVCRSSSQDRGQDEWLNCKAGLFSVQGRYERGAASKPPSCAGSNPLLIAAKWIWLPEALHTPSAARAARLAALHEGSAMVKVVRGLPRTRRRASPSRRS
jgi:hypothetical protein